MMLILRSTSAQKAEDCLGALRQDANGQAEAKSISQAMQQENILKHRDQVILQ